jgi:preprotein translocase subunit SecE
LKAVSRVGSGCLFLSKGIALRMENVDKLKVGAAVLLVSAGLFGFYWLPMDQKAMRVAAVLGGVLLAVVVLWFSSPGRRFVDYGRDSIKEAQKVVWPSKRETWQVTGLVFVFAVTLALFMWLVDSGLQWLFYDVLLRR